MPKVYKTVSFKLSPYEAELLTQLSSRKDQSVSEYIRSKIFDYRNKAEEELLQQDNQPQPYQDSCTEDQNNNHNKYTQALEQSINQSNQNNQEIKKYLKLISRITLSNNGMIMQTIAKDIAKEELGKIKKNAIDVIEIGCVIS